MFSLVLAWNFNVNFLLPILSAALVDNLESIFLVVAHGPIRIRQHDALCDTVFHALLQDNSGCKGEQR